MLFAPSREQARQFFFDAWRKYRAGEPLEGLERTGLEVVLLHPEYHPLLEQAQRHLDKDWLPEAGDLNPFLHLSLHLAVQEQLSIDQPPGIRQAFERLRARLGSEHEALHAVVECLGEIVWQAQRSAASLDSARYLECLERRLEQS
ncbi:MAG: DUF1841 family protein [Burkholderiales bacterium]